jgi:hypothetical protein
MMNPSVALSQVDVGAGRQVKERDQEISWWVDSGQDVWLMANHDA